MRRCMKETGQVSRKKTKVDCFANLPDDVLLDIFHKLPSDILRYKARFVCKRWFDLITNRILQDHASLILERSFGYNIAIVRLVDISEEKLDLKIKEQTRIFVPYDGRIKSWCNEFLLITDSNKNGSLYIYDLIRKQGSFLPPCPASCGGHFSCMCGIGLSYDKFKGVYKVVHVFRGPQIQCELLIFKDNVESCKSSKWKKIGGPYYTGQRQYFWDDPVSVQGRYFHWDVHCSKYLLSMDTVKERFRQTRLPGSDVIPMNKRYSLVEMDGFLTLLHSISLDEIYIWKLKDYRRSNWELLQSISVSSDLWSTIYPPGVPPRPVTCVKSKKYIIFRRPGPEGGLYSYDLKYEIVRRVDVDIKPGDRCVVRTMAAANTS